MRQILFCAAPAVSLATDSFAQTGKTGATQDAKLEQSLIKLKHDIGQAYVQRDLAALERLYADDYTVTNESGAIANKTQEVNRLRSGSAIYESTSYGDVRVRVYDNVAGRGTIKGRGENGAFHKQYFSTNVFVNRKGKGRAVGAHISAVKDL
jgi:hypothetical protein